MDQTTTQTPRHNVALFLRAEAERIERTAEHSLGLKLARSVIWESIFSEALTSPDLDTGDEKALDSERAAMLSGMMAALKKRVMGFSAVECVVLGVTFPNLSDLLTKRIDALKAELETK